MRIHASRCSSRLRLLLTLAIVSPLAFADRAAAQAAGGDALAGRLAAVKASAAANQTALRQYTWTETMQVSLNGEVKSTKQMSCRYGPDGKVQRTPIGPPPEQSGGPLRRRMVEKKTEELTGYMEQVKGVIGLYIPPDPARMEASFKAGNASLGRPAAGEAAIVFKNYAQPGDSMSLDFAMASRKMSGLSVNTSLDPSSPVALTVQMATLPDGTNYPSQEVINAPAKGIQVTVTNSGYQRLAN